MITYETLKTFCATDPLRPILNYAFRGKEGWWATDAQRLIYVPMEECMQGDERFQRDEIPENAGRYPNVESTFDVHSFTTKFLIPVKAIEDAINRLPLTEEMQEVERELKFIDCPECNGDGEIDITESILFNHHFYEAEATVECPICHGYGKIPDKEDYNPEKEDYDPESPEYSTWVPTGKMIPNVFSTFFRIPDFGYFRTSCFLDLIRVASEQGVTEIECSGLDDTHAACFRAHGVIVYIMSAHVPSCHPNVVDFKLPSLSGDG